jgi:hypothetical protein
MANGSKFGVILAQNEQRKERLTNVLVRSILLIQTVIAMCQGLGKDLLSHLSPVGGCLIEPRPLGSNSTWEGFAVLWL